MAGLARVFIFMMVGLSIVYVCMFFYLRAGARMRLEDAWVDAGRPGEREAWINDRIGAAVSRIRMWLVICVYVIPVVGLVTFVVMTN